MDPIIWVVGCGILAAFTIGLLRGWQDQSDAERRRAEREAYENRVRAKRAEEGRATVTDLIDGFFPHVRDAVAALVRDGTAPRPALREALLATDGVQLGTNNLKLPVVLPTAYRTRSTALIGKSGYGKTSVMNLLIVDSFASGHPVIVVCPEREMFEDYLLAKIPTERIRDAIVFTPGRSSTITFNPFLLEPGDDRSRVAAELFTVTKRAAGEDGSLGSRSDPILANAIAAVLGRRDASLEAVRRLLTDSAYRSAVVAEEADPYIRDFWQGVYPQYPKGAETPLLNRLDGFLRNATIRKVLTNPVSSISLRRVIEEKQLLLVDLSGLTPEEMRHVGELLMARLQLELVRRERIPGSKRWPVFTYVDEFPAVAGNSEQSWQTLLSRGRKYGAALCLGLQHPTQISQKLRDELFGNTSNVFVFNVSAKDAGVIRRELLVPGPDGVRKPVPAEQLVSLRVGEAIGRIGSGTCAMTIRFKKPIPEQERGLAADVREMSWRTHGAPPMTEERTSTSALPQEGSPGKRTPVRLEGSKKPTPGRGGKQHKLLQQLARQWGEERGFRGSLEQEILGGAGRVDVVLERRDMRIAIEVSVTSTPAEVAETVSKCVASGFTHVCVVANDDAALRRAQEVTRGAIPAKDRSKARFLSPDGFRLFLDSLSSSVDPQDLTAGFTVHAEPPAPGQMPHRRAVARLVGTALLQRRRPS